MSLSVRAVVTSHRQRGKGASSDLNSVKITKTVGQVIFTLEENESQT